MTVTLDAQLQKFIDDQVKSGRFSSLAEALAAGIARRMLDPESDVLNQQDLQEVPQSKGPHGN